MRVGWAGYVAGMGDKTKVYRILKGKPEKRGHLEEQVVDREITLS
jgi:hypothetical protein